MAHLERVRATALTIAREEGVQDVELVEVCALLHDVKDPKYSGSDSAGPEAVHAFMLGQGVEEARAQRAKTVVGLVGFKNELRGADAPDPVAALDAETRAILLCVRDADRLDAIGAIGIARCLTFGGARGRVLYDPDIPPRTALTAEAYRKDAHKTTTLNHFHEVRTGRCACGSECRRRQRAHELLARALPSHCRSSSS